jgi:3' terminal RNA ribose 2'-O-methyltransferase Hen1
MPAARRARITLRQGSLAYRDPGLAGFDAACAIEVIEHIDPPRLGAFERALFDHAQPGLVIVTTPNVEYNARFERLAQGAFRHRDHRFEWTRAEFEAWAGAVAERHGYGVTFHPIGPVDPVLGAPTQMGVFRR